MESYSSDRKKLSTLYILEILKKYTECDNDPGHCLTQAQIGDILYRDYGIVIDRKAIARGLDDLIYSTEFENKIELRAGYNEVKEKSFYNCDRIIDSFGQR